MLQQKSLRKTQNFKTFIQSKTFKKVGVGVGWREREPEREDGGIEYKSRMVRESWIEAKESR